jgi:hypothetical protein
MFIALQNGEYGRIYCHQVSKATLRAGYVSIGIERIILRLIGRPVDLKDEQ